MKKVSKRYARALFDLAQEKQAVPKILAEIDSVIALTSKHENLNRLFSTQLVARHACMNVISALADKLNLDDLLKRFLLVLGNSSRLNCLPDIFLELQQLNDKQQNVLNGEVVMAYALSSVEIDALTQALSEKFKETISIKTTVDPSLLGGMIIRLGPYCLDTSLRTKLKAFQTLVKG